MTTEPLPSAIIEDKTQPNAIDPDQPERDDAETDPARDEPEAEGAVGDGLDMPCADVPLATRIEALLLATERPVTEARLAALLGLPARGAAKAVREAIEALNEAYEVSERSFRAQRLAGGWQLMTTPDFGPLLARMLTERHLSRLSQAALETLAIVAYRQPIMRAELEAIRGVACGEVLRGLLERRLVKIVGRAEELGRPMLYGTTREFLNVFGLGGLDDLPSVEGLEPGRPAAPAPEPEASADGEGETQPAGGADDQTAEDAGPADSTEDAGGSVDESGDELPRDPRG